MAKVKFVEHRDSQGKLYKIDVLFEGMVSIEAHQSYMTYYYHGNRYPSQPTEFNPWGFYWLSIQVFNDITSGWEPQNIKKVKSKLWGEEIIPFDCHAWIAKKLGKLNGKKLHGYWLELQKYLDPLALEAAKKIYNANFRVGHGAGVYFLTRYAEHDKYLIKDIIQYRAAAHWADIFYNRTYDVFGNRNDWIAGYDENMDWMASYCVDYKNNKAARKTIQNLPGGLPRSALLRLVRVRFEQPITDRKQLIALTTMNGHAPRHERCVLRAKPELVKGSLIAVKNHNPRLFGNVTFRKTMDIISAVRYIGDYPEEYRGNLLGLESRSYRYHQALYAGRRRQPANRGGFLTSYSCSRIDDSVELHKPTDVEITHPHITFLDTAGALRQEGDEMHHCIGGYVEKGTSGRSFFFHIEHDGEKASAEVNASTGTVLQCHGPCNSKNKAVEYGKKELNKMFKKYRKDKMVKCHTNITDDLDWI